MCSQNSSKKETFDVFSPMLNILNKRCSERSKFRKISEQGSKIRAALHIKNKQKHQRWLDHETDLFYACLEIFGMDFSMIRGVLTHKTQRQINRKFHKEKKSHPDRINEALSHHQNNSAKQEEFIFKELFNKKEARDSNTPPEKESLKQQASKKLKTMIQSEDEFEEPDSKIQPLDFYLKDS